MSKIKLEDIREELQKEDWDIKSTKYENLDSELVFCCPEGHEVYSSWKKIRQKRFCPICENNIYKNQDTKIVPKKKGTTRFLGLDQATQITGFAIMDGDELIKFGTYRAGDGDEIERISKLKTWFINLIHNYQPDVIGFEDIQMQQIEGKQVYGNDNVVGIQTFKILAHLQGILMMTAYENDIPFVLCHTATWRQHCGVKGKTRTDKKRSMQLLVKEWFDVSVSEDEADSIGICKYVAKSQGRPQKIVSWE